MKNDSSMHFTKRDILTVLSVVFASFIYSIGINYFVKTGNLFPGGYAGIARLVSAIADHYFRVDINFSVIYFTLNLITAFIVWRHVGHKFVLYSGLFFTLSSIFTVPPYSASRTDSSQARGIPYSACGSPRVLP